MSETLLWLIFMLPVLTIVAIIVWGAVWKPRRINFYARLCFRVVLFAVRIRQHVLHIQGEPPASKIRFTWERVEKEEEDLPLEQVV